MKNLYPLFKIEDNVDAWEKLLEQAIPKIQPAFFLTSQRFNKLKGNLSVSLVDYLGIYEEGDWWVLTVLKFETLDKSTVYIFLPLTSIIPNQQEMIADENIAFGIETESSFYGKRNWKIVEATSLLPEISKLFYIEEPICDFIELHQGKFGGFDFHLKEKLQKELWRIETKVEFLPSGETQIKYKNSYSLIFPIYLAPVNSLELDSPGTIGYITYSTNSNEQNLLIALLKVQ